VQPSLNWIYSWAIIIFNFKVRRLSAYAKSYGLEPLDLLKQDVVTKCTMRRYETARPLSATIERGPLLSPNSQQYAKQFVSSECWMILDGLLD
jgi:hypothetical protein